MDPFRLALGSTPHLRGRRRRLPSRRGLRDERWSGRLRAQQGLTPGLVFQVYQNYIQMAVANGTNLTYNLYKTNGPTIGGSYVSLASWSTGPMNLSTSSGATSGIITAAIQHRPGGRDHPGRLLDGHVLGLAPAAAVHGDR